MSTSPTPDTPKTAAPAKPTAPEQPREIRIVSHCTLFYWWPVWAVGFLMAFVTFFTNQRMVIVEKHSTLHEKAEVRTDGKTLENRSAWVSDKGVTFTHPEMVRLSPNKKLGVLFCIVLLLVIAITNIPLRGLWSVIVIVFIVSLSIIFALLEWWEKILTVLGFLDIRINLEGYLVISSALLVLWLVVLLFFDRQVYMVFSPGQLRVRLEVGDAETAYDTTGMTIQKQRSDLFRHWILGIGSGDLIVRTTGAQSHQFDMPNVLFLGRKVREIEEMLRSRQVVTQKES